jgi:DNA helicase-2/ATP-dependent DNA helicase PcrA
MFEVLGSRTPAISSHDDKVNWDNDMKKLLELRSNATIGHVLDHLKLTERPRLPEKVEQRERELSQVKVLDELSVLNERIRKLRNVSYQEVVALFDFIEKKTPFATKHGVKGEEYENVLVVAGRGWNNYNFNQYLEWSGDSQNIPLNKKDAFERNRNLFYVACSRPINRLSILFTQEISKKALSTLSNWFGENNIQSL